MLLAWAPFVVRAVQIYVSSNFRKPAFLAPKAETFREFLEQQGIFVFFVTIYVGAGLIANDRRANALQLYLSKPLTRAEYIAGKLAILFVFLACVTCAAGDDRCSSCRAMFAGSFDVHPQQHVTCCRRSRCSRWLQVLLASTTMLALSSMSKSSRFVGDHVCGADVLHHGAVQRAARHHRLAPSFAWLSPTDALEQLGDVIFRLHAAIPAVAAPSPA